MEKLKEQENLRKEYSQKNKKMVKAFLFNDITTQEKKDSFLLDLYLNSGLSEKKLDTFSEILAITRPEIEAAYWCEGIAQDDVVKTDLMKSVLNGKHYVSVYIRLTRLAKVSLIAFLKKNADFVYPLETHPNKPILGVFLSLP
jgi:hypothetical protein